VLAGDARIVDAEIAGRGAPHEEVRSQHHRLAPACSLECPHALKATVPRGPARPKSPPRRARPSRAASGSALQAPRFERRASDAALRTPRFGRRASGGDGSGHRGAADAGGGAAGGRDGIARRGRPFDPVEKKEPGWALEDEAERLALEVRGAGGAAGSGGLRGDRVTPLREAPLQKRSYRLQLTAPRRTEVKYPVLIERGGHWDGVRRGRARRRPSRCRGRASLPRMNATCRPGGAVSGDPGAMDSLPGRRVWIDAFAIARGRRGIRRSPGSGGHGGDGHRLGAQGLVGDGEAGARGSAPHQGDVVRVEVPALLAGCCWPRTARGRNYPPW
jgi:hypothetical protein